MLALQHINKARSCITFNNTAEEVFRSWGGYLLIMVLSRFLIEGRYSVDEKEIRLLTSIMTSGYINSLDKGGQPKVAAEEGFIFWKEMNNKLRDNVEIQFEDED